MLNGVGGSTVKQAKERISYREFLDWCSYIEETGSLDLGGRFEQGIAMLSMVVNRSAGGKSNIEDFLPKRQKPEDEVADIGKVFGMLKVASRTSKARTKD